MTIDDFFKTVGYAYIYKGLGETVDQIPIDQLTVSMFREGYPEEEFRSQLEPLDDRLVEIANGVERSKATEFENLVADFCTAYEKHAFIEGMKVGAKMVLELVE